LATKKLHPLSRRAVKAYLFAGFLTYGTLPFAFPAYLKASDILKSTHPITVAVPFQFFTGFPFQKDEYRISNKQKIFNLI